MYHYFDDPIEKEFINILIEKIDVEENVDLYFATQGGYCDVMNYLIDFLNTKSNITVHLVESVMSAGCLLLTEFKGKIILENGLDFFMFHLFDRQIYTLRKDKDIDDTILCKQTNKLNVKFAEKLKKKGILTDKQIKKFLKGGDVVVYQKQFRKWQL